VGRLHTIVGNPFSGLAPGTTRSEELIAYVAREHARGRTVRDVLADAYLAGKVTPRQRDLLLDEPLLIRALIRDYEARGRLAGEPPPAA
jgi:hypothetical protein